MGDIYYEWITGKKEERMTREEAIRIATGLRTDFKCESETMVDFCNTIIQALEQEPKTGRWIEHEHNGIGYLECPRCSVWFLWMHLTRNSYCPNCGAKLGVEE